MTLTHNLRRIAVFLLFSICLFGQIPNQSFDPATVQAMAIDAVRRQVDDLNRQQLGLFVGAAQSWEINAQRAQLLGLSAPAKPAPPIAWEVIPRETSGDPNILPIAVVQRGTPLAPVIPDLAPPAPKPSGVVVSIGVKLYGSYYQAKADDTAPADYEATLDGHRYRRLANPWGGYWLRLN